MDDELVAKLAADMEAEIEEIARRSSMPSGAVEGLKVTFRNYWTLLLSSGMAQHAKFTRLVDEHDCHRIHGASVTHSSGDLVSLSIRYQDTLLSLRLSQNTETIAIALKAGDKYLYSTSTEGQRPVEHDEMLALLCERIKALIAETDENFDEL